MRTLLPCLLPLLAVSGAAQADGKRPHAPEVDLASMVEFGSSSFTMGIELQEPSAYGDSWFIDQTPAREVTLGAYHIDATEVTAEAFALFLSYAAGEYHFHPDQPIERLHEGYAAIEGSERLPVTAVTWEAAHHYCLWAAKRLPTEAEWERAAAGTEARTYPWDGDDGPSCDRVSYFTGSSYCQDGPVAVGSFPDGATPEGVLDLAGNAAEWTADWYGDYPSEAQTDPAGPEAGTLRVVRGGSFLEWSQALRTHTRRGVDPGARSPAIGFRCAWSEDADDGAIRGDLQPPDVIEREETDRPLARPAEVPDVLVEGLAQPTEIERFGSAWYVLDDAEAAVYRVSGDDPEPVPIAEGFLDPVALAADAQGVYVTDAGAGEIWRLDDGGDHEVVADGRLSPGRIVADGDLFWAEEGGLYRLSGDASAERIAEVYEVVDLALSPTHLYYAADDGVSGGEEIGRVARGGSEEPEILYEGFSSSNEPTGVAYDPDDDTAYYFAQRSSWPSSVEICELRPGADTPTCFAHAPPKSQRPVVFDGALHWTSQYTVARLDPADDTYEEVGPWANAKDVSASDLGIVWTDASDGRVYRIDLD